MPNCIVIADDLTGANATGVLLKKSGFNTMTLLRNAMVETATLKECDCLVVPTNSRAIPRQEAYTRVRECLEALRANEVRLYAKRIDSTLRGNLGSETEAFLDVLGEEYMAVCVPVFPSSGRALVGGHLLVGGVPLRLTEAAKDPKCPVHLSDAHALLQQQTKYPVAAVHLDDIADGVEALSKRIRELREGGARILLADGVTAADMETVADALVMAAIPVITVDPGPFTALMAARLLTPAYSLQGTKVLCAIGSVNGVAAAQTRRLLSELPVTMVMLDAGRILESPESRRQEIDRLVEELTARRNESPVLAVVGNGIDPAMKLSLKDYEARLGLSTEELSELINHAFAEVALRVLAADSQIRGLYSTGGDITAAIHQRAGTLALRLLDEVVPLAGYAQAIGGTLRGLYCISKGGMVGDERAMVTCVNYLRDRLNETAH